MPSETDAPPPELRPARVNAKALFTVGTVAWLVALAVIGVLHLTGGVPDGRYALICVTGVAFGAAGFWWAHRIHLINDEGVSE